MLEEYLKEELVFLGWDVAGRNELFEKLSEIFHDKGYVNDGFYEYLTTREDNYPTGLQLEHNAVAIPHGDPQYINEPFIAVARLKNPVKMNKMESPDEQIDVSLFFILGLKEGSSHISVLRQLIGHIQQKEFVDGVMDASSPEQLINIIVNSD